MLNSSLVSCSFIAQGQCFALFSVPRPDPKAGRSCDFYVCPPLPTTVAVSDSIFLAKFLLLLPPLYFSYPLHMPLTTDVANRLVIRFCCGSLFVTFLPMTASKVFISEIISDERKMLAVYPVFFFYTFISWMIVIH